MERRPETSHSPLKITSKSVKLKGSTQYVCTVKRIKQPGRLVQTLNGAILGEIGKLLEHVKNRPVSLSGRAVPDTEAVLRRERRLRYAAHGAADLSYC